MKHPISKLYQKWLNESGQGGFAYEFKNYFLETLGSFTQQEVQEFMETHWGGGNRGTHGWQEVYWEAAQVYLRERLMRIWLED